VYRSFRFIFPGENIRRDGLAIRTNRVSDYGQRVRRTELNGPGPDAPPPVGHELLPAATRFDVVNPGTVSALRIVTRQFTGRVL